MKAGFSAVLAMLACASCASRVAPEPRAPAAPVAAPPSRPDPPPEGCLDPRFTDQGRQFVDQLGLSVTYGDFHYDIGPVDVRRAGAVHAAFARPSWQTLNRYIDSLGSAYIGHGRLGPTPGPGSRLESARPTG